ncbi:MAG: glucoamylase family protein [Balneolaceae bacterium]
MIDNSKVSFNVNFLKERARDVAKTQKYTIQNKNLVPIKPVLDSSKKTLESAYRVLARLAKNNEEISPASEWLIDNFYIIQEQIVEIANDFPPEYQKNIPVLTGGDHKGLPRVYELILTLVVSTDNRVDMDNLTPFVQSYQQEETLMLGEIWAIPIMARFVLIQQLADRVGRILKRKKIQKDIREFVNEISSMDTREPGIITHEVTEWLKNKGNSSASQELLVELANQFQTAGLLKDEQKRWFIFRFNQFDVTLEEALRIQAQKESILQVSIQNAVVSLRSVSESSWFEFGESMSVVDQILRLDPSGSYSKMDFRTRDQYRKKVEKLAKYSDYSETDVAEQVLLMAEEYAGTPGSLHLDYLHDETAPKKHIGYYLLGEGYSELIKVVGYKMPLRERVQHLMERKPAYYAGLIGVNTIILLTVLWIIAGFTNYSAPLTFVALFVAFFPAMDLSVALVNRFFAFFFSPRILPKMKYDDGIPSQFRTLVVVPTMINSLEDIIRQIKQAEIHSLSNSDPAIQYGLLTDFPDSDQQSNPGEEEILRKAGEFIDELNRKYPSRFGDKFFLMHRRRSWNETEKTWMGWERKRGKLEEFNRLLYDTSSETSYHFIKGKVLPSLKNSPVQFVITLDADTRLPPGSANDMIRTASHPLNRAWLDPEKQRITKGYAVIQPRISIPPDAVGKTRFTRIFSGNVGLNPYSASVSDIYQDLAGEAVFLGKGIYDVNAFHEVMEQRLPDNRILSHDLLESTYLRTGLSTDIELFDSFPNTYISFSKRNHRWIRGDWQIARWLFSPVPHKTGNETNPINFLSKWKIFDNLRRSLSPFFLTVFFITGWFWLPGSAWLWTLLAFGILAFPIYMSLSTDIINRPARVKWKLYFEKVRDNLRVNSAQAFSTLIFLPHQAMIYLDAIGRSLWRLWISKKNLLEWTTAFQTEQASNLQPASYVKNMAVSVALGLLILVFWAVAGPLQYWVVLPFAIIWIAAPYYAWYISKPVPEPVKTYSRKDEIKLKIYARQTWFYFERFVTKENFWLPPDNYQEDPPMRPVNRTSPTNIGLAMVSTQVAYNRGFISFGELLYRHENTLRSLEKLERYKGHFFNWYETSLGEVLSPRYVSTVDSGNLAAGFIVVKEALKQEIESGQINRNVWEGLRDTIRTVRHLFEEKRNSNSVPEDMYNRVMISTGNMLDRLDADKIKKSDDCLGQLKKLKEIAAQLGSTDLRSLRNTLGDEQMEHLLFWIETPLNQIEKFIDEYRNLGAESNEKITGKTFSELEQYLKRTDGKQLPETIKNWHNQAEYIIKTCQRFFNDMDFSFLYLKERSLFTIGFNLEKSQYDKSTYDLLASEARIASYIAIAKGDVPHEHWFRLSRRLTRLDKNEILLSWSGTMFEYLMPLLFLKSYPNTLLANTYHNVVKWQTDYALKRGWPWGFSESAYGFLNIELHYQYRAFGAPGLGLKRGLADEYVVAPYASMLSLMLDPKSALSNLKNIEGYGGLGMIGFYDALDFSSSRLQEKETHKVVKTYMAHHHGMSLIAIENTLNGDFIQQIFHSDPQIKSCDLLLQEQIPRGIPIKEPHPIDVELEPGEQQTIQVVVEHAGMEELDSSPPRLQMMSNGNYSTFVTHSGTGCSFFGEKAISAWKPDPTTDPLGFYFYIKDQESDKFWSAAHQPVKRKADRYDTWFHNGKTITSRVDEWIESTMAVCVSPDTNMEFRKLTLTNYSDRERTLEITSYAEAVLNKLKDHNSHPAFSKLFLQTDYLAEHHALLVKRRPRGEHEEPEWLIHTYAGEESDNLLESLQYETEKSLFIGRGRGLDNPRAMDQHSRLSGSLGNVSDPIVSLRNTVTLKPGEKKDLTFGLGRAGSREEAYMLADLYDNLHATDRVFDLAAVYSNVELEHVNITSRQAHYFQKLASYLIYPSSEYRGDVYFLERNREKQHRLWAYGISGDVPLLVYRVNDTDQIKDVKTLVKAYEFWRQKGFITELLFLNDYPPSYADEVQEAIQKEMQSVGPQDMQQGGIYLHRTEKMPDEDLTLILTVAHAVLKQELPALSFDKKPRDVISWSRGNSYSQYLPSIAEKQPSVSNSDNDANENLLQFNGYGGFNKEGNEYHIIIKQDTETGKHKLPPAPWINVISNSSLGFIATETGGGYTWSENSRENKLTGWANEPVSDPPSEAFYIRDEEKMRYWSPVCSEAKGPGTYKTIHGFGYTRYEYVLDELEQNITQFVPDDDSVKVSVLKLHNRGESVRKLSVFRYQELVHGVERDQSVRYIIPAVSDNKHIIYSRNHYNNEFAGRVGFLALTVPEEKEVDTSFTTNRMSFIGRNRSLKNPAAIAGSERLNNRAEAGEDICAAIQAELTLQPGEEISLIFLTGETADQLKADEITEKYSESGRAEEELARVKKYWDKTLSRIRVETPDNSLNLMLNGWLMYQNISCRMHSRTAYYQAGGAFGFRDQLQDSAAAIYVDPQITREQLLLHASKQFPEGDVLHWWHPPAGRGIRSKITDDRLWLPYVLIHYLHTTADDSILEEEVPYISARELKPDEHEVYVVPEASGMTGTLYEHCCKAIDISLQFGSHGLPLMGAGDWNDGMNRVGKDGKGESVWLGFFIYGVLEKFIPVCRKMKDEKRAERYKEQAVKLKKHLNREGWDGKWYLRAFYDDGTPLGSSENEECKIDAISQAWSVITGAATEERGLQVLKAVEEHLISEEDKIIRLLTPAFDQTEKNPGYIKGYIPGVRENGGQYTHGALWVAKAFAESGQGTKAAHYLGMINPVNHSLNEDDVSVYKVEPYAVAADVYGEPPLTGRGGWTWYTGSAGWFYRVAIESVLGLEIMKNKIIFQPCIPSDWKEFTISIRQDDDETVYHITIKNPDGLEQGQLTGTADGSPVVNKGKRAWFKTRNDRKDHKVELTLKTL